MKKGVDGAPRARGRPRCFDREEALERAMQVFWRHGYEATSLSDLTAAMDINPPSLYAAFGSKERLFLEAVERYRSGPGDSESILAAAPTARLAIERLLESSASELVRRSHPPGCMLVISAMSCSRASARVAAALAKHRANAENRIRARIQRGVRDGELSADTDAAALARFYMAVIEGMSIQARDGATRQRLLETAATAMRAWPDQG